MYQSGWNLSKPQRAKNKDHIMQIGSMFVVLLLQGINIKDHVSELVPLEKYMEVQNAMEPDQIIFVMDLPQLQGKLSSHRKE